MSPLAVFLFRAHRARDLRYGRRWMQNQPDGTVAIVDTAAAADVLHRTWHDTTGEYLVLSVKVNR